MFQHWDELDSGLHSGSVGVYAVHQLQQVSFSCLQSLCFCIIIPNKKTSLFPFLRVESPISRLVPVAIGVFR